MRILAALLVVAASHAHAAPPLDGNDLFEWLSKPGSSQEFGAASYIKGFFEGESILSDLHHRAGLADPLPYCPPDHVTGRQLFDITKKYLADHPADRSQQAADLLITAFMQAWPCSQKSSH